MAGEASETWVSTSPRELSLSGRRVVLAAAFLGWLCAGLEMGLLPLASRPAVRAMLFEIPGEAAIKLTAVQEAQFGTWFARYMAAFLLGAAIGGWVFGRLGDRAGRVRAMGMSILCFSVLTGLSWFVQSPEQLLVLRFLASLGIGGMWPAGVALVSEAWPDRSRPLIAGVIGTAANLGILLIAADPGGGGTRGDEGAAVAGAQGVDGAARGCRARRGG